MNRKIYKLIGMVLLALVCDTAFAFAVYPIGGGQYEKWGASNDPGTPGGVVTWGFMPVGTQSSSYCNPPCTGTNTGAIEIENGPNQGYTLTSLSSLQSYFLAAFDKWSAVANISFKYIGPSDPGADSGLPINDPAATSPMIRIGAFAFDPNNRGAVGYAPPPNGGTGAGDILFNSLGFYAFQPGNEGDHFPPLSTAPNDFEGLLLHEMGHAIGLDHPAVDGTCPVMQVNDPSCYGIINRQLKADDIAGAQFLYGAVVVPLPPAIWLFGSVVAFMGGFFRQRKS